MPNEIYNQEVKQRFLRENLTSIQKADEFETIFRQIEKYETAWNCDLCAQSVEILTPVLDNLFGARQHGKQRRIAMLKEYVKWCVDNQIPGANPEILEITVSGLEKIKTTMVASPVQLQAYLNQICDPETERTTDLVIRAFYWMAFAGMREEDIQDVAGKNLDFDNMLIRYGDDSYEIYREAVLALKLSATLTEFVYKHPNYQHGNQTIRNRVPGNELIRGIRGKATLVNMRTLLSRRSKACVSSGKTNLQLSYNRARLSGLFYRTRMAELQGIPVDFTEEAKAFMIGKDSSLQRKAVKEYLSDYQLWKQAFSL